VQVRVIGRRDRPQRALDLGAPGGIDPGQSAAHARVARERHDRQLVALAEQIGDHPAALDHVLERLPLHRARHVDDQHQRERRTLALEPGADRLDLDRRPQRLRRPRPRDGARFDVLVLATRNDAQ
jgi:hypothetical protein